MTDAGFETSEVFSNFAHVTEGTGALSVSPLSDADGEDKLGPDWVVYVVGRVPG